MADKDENAEILPLHCTVKDASGGDAGWVWYGNEWQLGKIVWSEDDQDHALVLSVGEHTEIFNINDMTSVPWFPIFRPPYEGNEKPCTHAVTIMDRRASLTFSWNMNVSDGKRAVQKVTSYIDAMLRDTDAPAAV